MRAIRGLTLLALLAALGWGAYWFIGARALDRAIEAGLAHVPEISADSHSVRGFPNRFDVTFDAPRIATPGFDWQAPFVQLFALSYRLNHLLAVFAPDQSIRIGGAEFSVHAEDLRASLVLEPGLDLPLDRFTLVGEALQLQGGGATDSLETLRLASRRLPEGQHQIALLAEGVIPDPAALAQADPQGLWPRRYALLRLDAEAAFDPPLDRHLFDGPPPRLADFALTGAQAQWEGGEIALAGRLVPGPDGALSGEVMASLTGWEAMLERLRAIGLLTDEAQDFLRTTLGTLAAQSDGGRLEVPLSVISGEVWLGPAMLGLLPCLPFGLR